MAEDAPASASWRRRTSRPAWCCSTRSWPTPPGCLPPATSSGPGCTKRTMRRRRTRRPGTALQLKRDMEQAGYARPIDVSSTRAGQIPGTHTIGFDGPGESITLSHTARDRTGLRARRARGGPLGRRAAAAGITMRDVLGVRPMRTPWTGVGHRAGHAVHVERRPRRSRRPAARPPPDRRRHPLPRALRHDRREPDADRSPSASGSSRSWWTRRPAKSPVLAGRRRLQHP